jgi:hypothetical protein
MWNTGRCILLVFSTGKILIFFIDSDIFIFNCIRELFIHNSISFQKINIKK